MPQRGTGTIRKRGRIWWVQVSVDGQVTRQSSRSEKYEDAVRLRNKLLGQKARGELGGRHARPTINGLLDYFLNCLRVRVRPATLKIQKLVVEARLRPCFGSMKADTITTQRLLIYREQRAQEGAKASTINRELSLLRNCLRTAAHSTPPLLNVAAIPRFPITNEDAFARQGFLEDEQFERLIAELPKYLEPLAVVAYNTGIRRGELLRIEWDQVDFTGRVVRLYRGATKTGDPRTVPMIGRMEQVLMDAKAERDESWPECPWVFNRLGERVNDFRGAWESACDRAGLQGLLFHDLRRSGARNLSRAGVPERTIMAITGHKTRAMFDRYNIVSESDLADAATKMKLFRESKKQPGRVSTGIQTPNSTDTISDTEPEKTSSD
jgi:integrase